MSVWEQQLAAFAEQTASASPTPGGGSVACVSASLGAGLAIMAAEITKKSAPSPELDAWLAEARSIFDGLRHHADRDVEAFEAYMRALALPRATDDEKRARRAALADAAFAATEAPLAAARDVDASLALAVRLAPLVKRNVASDVLAGADLLDGALRAVLRNVDVNLPSIADDGKRSSFAAERTELERRGRDLREAVVRALASP